MNLFISDKFYKEIFIFEPNKFNPKKHLCGLKNVKPKLVRKCILSFLNKKRNWKVFMWNGNQGEEPLCRKYCMQ